MVDPDRRPTAQEIEELIDLVQRDPASPAFIDLGEAYLALGRPRDALGVGGVGLAAIPDSMEGRVMVARAYSALHLWKEAQGELLRVVKIDRNNRRGFALLGEVLLRRNDFERAVPVLQHAQNLDPTSPLVLALLKRARAGQPLDPPPPLPTPMPPRGESMADEVVQRSTRRNSGQAAAAAVEDDLAVPVARTPASAKTPAPTPVPRKTPPPQRAVAAPVAASVEPAAPAVAKRSAAVAAQPAPSEDYEGEDATRRGGPDPEPARQPPAAPRVEAAAVREEPVVPATSFAPPPLRPPPRSRPQRNLRNGLGLDLDAASAGAVAPSATFLNDLLTAKNPVRDGDAPIAVRPDMQGQPVRRSARLVFGVLFTLLVIGAVGGGLLYWYTEKLNREAIADLQRQAKAAIANGDHVGLTTSIGKLAEALDKDRTNAKTLAYAGETAALDALLYGAPADAADQAIAKAATDITITDDGWRELVIGRAAVDLSRLGVAAGRPASEVARVANSTLVEVGKSLDDYLATAPADKWAQWLRARALLAAGKRKAAIATLDDADKGEDGLVVAMIDRAALYADEGALDDAIALYDKALKRSPGHPLAVLGKALARALARVEPSRVIDDITTTLSGKSIGSRVSAYRSLATGLAELGTEDYAKANEQLKSAVMSKPLTDDGLCSSGPAEPRFWAAVAWGAYARGDLVGTAGARNCIAWYGKDKAEDDPAVQVIDAALAAASGHPEKTLAIAAPLAGTRARLLRLHADLDLGRVKDALAESTELIKRTTPADGDAKRADLEARIFDAEARFENATEKERDPIASELDALARQAQSKLGHHALGMAYLAVGDLKDAQPALEDAVVDITDANPNPLAYRTRTALADLLIGAANEEQAKQPDDAKDKLTRARALLEAALKQDSGYDPALATEAKLVLREGDPEKAAALLEPILREGDAPPTVLLTFAEVLVARKDATQEDKDHAAAILRDIKDKIRVPAEVGRVANLIDSKLPAELDVPVPPDAPGPPGAPKPPKPGHH